MLKGFDIGVLFEREFRGLVVCVSLVSGEALAAGSLQ